MRVGGSAQAQPFVPGRIVVKPRTDLSDEDFGIRMKRQGALHTRRLGHGIGHIVNVSEKEMAAVLARLRKDPEIEYAEPDYLTQASFVPNDPLAVNEWHLPKIQAQEAWNVTTGAPNIIIAVLDSGVNAAHPDLVGRLLPGYDFVANDNDPADDFGHGTAVTGTLVASGNNQQGVAGLCFGCRVLPVKVMDASGSAPHSAIAQGIEYAVAQGARIINLSLGGDWPSATLQNAINFAWSNNVIIVAAAGNGGGTAPQYPAACDHVVGVAATDSTDGRAWFSSYGSFVTLFAPGVNIWTTQRDMETPYGGWSGTSLACPVVAGVAALVASANGLLSNFEIGEILKQNADDLGMTGYDSTFAYGRVNAFRALSSIGPALNNSGPPPEVYLMSPFAGAEFVLGTAVPLNAFASSTGTVVSLEFFANGSSLASSASAEFGFDWTPTAAGNYALSAIAVDERGLRGTSAPVTIRISSPDTVPPSIKLLSGPINGARTTSPAIPLAGAAFDNVGIERVEVQVNDRPPQLAEGTGNWNAEISLTPGTNVIRIRSVDFSGNISAQLTRTVKYVMTAPLAVQIQGKGNVVPNLNGARLEVGKSYRLRAVPAGGQVFLGWSAGSQSALLNFVMETNLTLVANFIPNPFVPAKGTYSGLMANTNGVTPNSSGSFTITTTRSGLFTGKLILGGTRLGFRGKLNLAGDAKLSIRRTGLTPLSLALHVDLTNGTDEAVGQLTNGDWTSELSGDRNIFRSSSPAPQAGLRSFILQRAEDEATAASGSSKIGITGLTTVRGKLSDGRVFLTRSALAKNGDCPFYLSLNRASEVVIGWLNFPIAGPGASGTVLWVNSGTNAFATILRATSAPAN